MDCQNKKDLHGVIACLRKAQRPVRELRSVLQTAKRLPIPEVLVGWQGFLFYLPDSTVKLQKIPENRI